MTAWAVEFRPRPNPKRFRGPFVIRVRAQLGIRLIPKRLLQISPIETKLERRGFSVTVPEIQERLEDAGAAFLEGYHAALDESRPQVLTGRLAAISPDRRGFAFEGAGMSLLLQDRLTLFGRRHRFATFAEGYGDGHIYMLHVGAGWALARLPGTKRRLDRAIVVFDALLRWLVVDGFGFHEGYFHSNQSILRCRVPAGLGAY